MNLEKEFIKLPDKHDKIISKIFTHNKDDKLSSAIVNVDGNNKGNILTPIENFSELESSSEVEKIIEESIKHGTQDRRNEQNGRT